MPPTHLDITVSYDPKDPQRDYILDQIRLWNKPYIPPELAQATGSVALFLKDSHQKILGGIFGDAYLACMFVKIFWISDQHRHRGHGTTLLARMEDEARKLHCTQIALDTLDFQAPRFYEKLGFQQFGFIEHAPGGPIRYFYKKPL